MDEFPSHLADAVVGEQLPEGVETYFLFKILGIKHTFSKWVQKYGKFRRTTYIRLSQCRVLFPNFINFHTG